MHSWHWPLLLRESFKFVKMGVGKSLVRRGLRWKKCFKFVSSCFKFVAEVSGMEEATFRLTKNMVKMAENAGKSRD